MSRQHTTFLSDPDRKVPFFIQNENTTARYLTGSDFDPESIQVVGNEWWIGDEFGPYVLRVTPQSKVLGVVETVVAGNAFKGPDHYLNARLPNYPGDAGFALPHLGPEGLTLINATHIVVVNGNNCPFSSGCTIGQPDDNELTLLDIKALVDAR